MATRLHKILWSILCGTALGIGATSCYESDGGDMYGPPPDTATDGDADVDAEADAADAEPENIAMYGPAPAYGPPPP